MKPTPDLGVTGRLEEFTTKSEVRDSQTVSGIFDNEDALFDELFKDDSQPNYEPYVGGQQDSKPLYLYRGQNKRFGRAWPPENKDEWEAGDKYYESLIPNDTREYEKWIRDGKLTDNFNPYVHGNNYTYCKEAVAYMVACTRAMLINDTSVLAWISSLRSNANSTTHTKFGSLGQHYRFLTGYLDWTSSIDVAVWMATHDWESGDYKPGQHVIYRMNYQECEDLVFDLNQKQKLDRAFPISLVDIRDTPQLIAQRPSVQHGWSFVGMEQHNLIENIVRNETVTAFDFEGSAPSNRNFLVKSQIAPEDDYYTDLHSFPLPEMKSDEEVQAWLTTEVQTRTGLNLNVSDDDWLLQLINGWDGS